LEGHVNKVSAITLSQDGKYIISGAYDNLIKIWDFHTGELLKTLDNKKKYKTEIFDVKLSMD